MELDLETFLTTLYVMVDDLYQQAVRPKLPAAGGPPPKLSDSEVLCLGLAAQWRAGVPWRSERGFVRYARRHLRPRRRRGAIPGLTRTVERRHAKGVVGVIAPWNYPLTLAVSDAIPALLAGNGVVLKPDSQTPFTALLAAAEPPEEVTS